MRIGLGFDVHAFIEGRKLILGGIQIDYFMGLDGHSDADVLVHSIMDALLGAAGMGDIGVHFPDSDIKYKDISSIKLLEKVNTMITQAGYSILNIDSVLILENPKIAPFTTAMKSKIAACLNIKESLINIKATTSEGLGFCGRHEGAAAQSIALLEYFN